jgi:hypothetical protein
VSAVVRRPQLFSLLSGLLPRLNTAGLSIGGQHGQDLGGEQRRVPTDAQEP